MKYTMSVLLIMLIVVEVGYAQQRPPLSKWRIACEVGTGAGLGIVYGIGGGAVCSAFGEDLDVLIISLCVGWILGNAHGVYIAGTWGDNIEGSFFKTLIGSAIGFLVYPIIGSTAGATIAFNMSRKYKSPPAGVMSLINMEGGQTFLSIPMIYCQGDGRGSLSHSIDLLRMKF